MSEHDVSLRLLRDVSIRPEPVTQTTQATRRITQRTRGSQHGFIRRMVRPGDLGESIKPFIVLDCIHGRVEPGTGLRWHPRSGLATLTYSLNSESSGPPLE
jgi:redox-sensitive bicupin YhaK (pirin superfamily)